MNPVAAVAAERLLIRATSSSRTIGSSRSGLPRASDSDRVGRCTRSAAYEGDAAIRKGQVRWVAKGDTVAQRQFIHSIFGIAA